MAATTVPASTYAGRRERLAQQLQSAAGRVALKKKSSNLFRDRDRADKPRLDVRDFNHILRVEPDTGWADAEGMTPYENLVLATLACGTMPAVVPQLKTITLGGAVAGVGIEASSFRYGLVHHGVLEMDILAGDGEVYLCTPQNEHSDLFFGFPNSYGTLGYALRVRTKTIPVLAADGRTETRVWTPVCTPTPAKIAGPCRVCWNAELAKGGPFKDRTP